MATNEQVKRVIPTGGTDTNALYIEVKVFLEGVEVPHTACAVSYGIDSPPTCSITIPANSFLRTLPETTKILVIFKDLLPDPVSGEYEWRVLFDGELSGFSYTVSPNGADISLSGIHTSAYLTLMQLMNQSVTEYIYNRVPKMIGDFVTVTIAGMNKTHVKFIENLLEKADKDKCYHSMGDLVYLILRNMLEGYKDKGGPTAAWYWKKLGPGVGGYKILDRIYGVSPDTKKMPLIECELQEENPYDDNVYTDSNDSKITSEEQREISTRVSETESNVVDAYRSVIPSSHTGGYSDQELKELIVRGWIQSGVEGSYSSVNWEDGAEKTMSIGISGWHEGRLDMLLELIGTPEALRYYKMSPKTKESVNARGSESDFIAMLNSEASRAAQIKLASQDTPVYIKEARAAGITNPQCIIYAAMWMPICRTPNGLANRDVGLFIKNRADRYDINNPEQLAKMFRLEVGNALADGFNYGDRSARTLNYVKSAEVFSTNNANNSTPNNTTEVIDSQHKQNYTPNVTDTQRID